MTSEGDVESERLPDFARYQRIGWPRLLLDEFSVTHPDRSSGRIVWWMNRRGSEDRYLIALSDYSYVVIVAERADYVLLVTAYPVEFEGRRRKLRAEFGVIGKKEWTGS